MTKIADFSRRHLLMAGTAAGFYAAAAPVIAGVRSAKPDLIVPADKGTLQILALGDRAIRVRFTPVAAGLKVPPSPILQSDSTTVRPHLTRSSGKTRLTLPHIACEVDRSGALRFYDKDGRLLLQEAAGTRRLSPSSLGDETTCIAEQSFVSPPDERLFGTGCFQDGALNLRGLPRRLTQVNTQISLPFVLSSKGYGLLWHNTGMVEFNPPAQVVRLEKSAGTGDTQVQNVTTTTGNAQVARHTAVFEGEFEAASKGKYAFQLDIGRKMASRHYVEIDGVAHADFSNLWLPPTTSFLADLEAGMHHVKVIANQEDQPQIALGPVADTTVWRSPVAEALDYVVIAGPDADGIMAGYRDLLGATPLMPRWAYGYIHCRERFHSSDEIIATAKEFRKRRLPVDIMVQDWQYWGKYGWNAMRFDETYYPDPKALTDDLHGMDMRLMLSVWSKFPRETELGKVFAAKNFLIPNTEWVDFFNPEAAGLYWENVAKRLLPLGIDAWWQDATEPENDDLSGRTTAAGKGEHVRLAYPLQVSRTVYEGQRRSAPDRRVMILTRSAFLGQQRYGSATWSGDIGSDWETLKRQIPAGLNMAAAGYPYWTVDAGGFFRPGDTQYTDVKYHERLLRWFQYATFLPLQRVHGYMTKTEFWEYGDAVETIARQYLELRYRLLPYIYSTAAEVTRHGGTLMRPLVFDFAHDPQALEEGHSYMFGRALHVAPVTEADVQTWPVYLPQSPGGWYDFWTGEHREGGQVHQVDAPLSRIPLHVRAGSILPLGPVIQSTAEATGGELELRVYPGRDGSFALYEDNGLTYAYEGGEHAVTPMRWDDKRNQLVIDHRAGHFAGMTGQRPFEVFRAGAYGARDGATHLHYDGSARTVPLSVKS
ncbi:MAG: TIM-barrel domain-containing protein [Asticcacaulis sp.]